MLKRHKEPAVLEMARPGLRMDLAAAIREVVANQREYVRKGVAIEHNGGHISIDLTVKPFSRKKVAYILANDVGPRQRGGFSKNLSIIDDMLHIHAQRQSHQRSGPHRGGPSREPHRHWGRRW